VGTSNDHFYGQSQHGSTQCCRKGLICLNFTTRIPQILRKSMRLSPVPYRLNTVMLLF
jgi:hypothetical protein